MTRIPLNTRRLRVVLRDDQIPRGEAARGAFHIVHKTRRRASPPPGFRQLWEEYQVKWGRLVVSRHDFHHQAEKWVNNRIERKD